MRELSEQEEKMERSLCQISSGGMETKRCEIVEVGIGNNFFSVGGSSEIFAYPINKIK